MHLPSVISFGYVALQKYHLQMMNRHYKNTNPNDDQTWFYSGFLWSMKAELVGTCLSIFDGTCIFYDIG
jgi:hypothetical protein